MARKLETVAFGPGMTIERHRLDNGLTVLVQPDASASVLSYQTWFRVGSRHERPGKTGIAHLFEHLMFMGTKKVPVGQFDTIMEGAGGSNNATTSTSMSIGGRATIPSCIISSARTLSIFTPCSGRPYSAEPATASHQASSSTAF